MSVSAKELLITMGFVFTNEQIKINLEKKIESPKISHINEYVRIRQHVQ